MKQSNNIINVAVDIESLSLRADAAILSIAAVPFDISPEVSGQADRNPFLKFKDKNFYEVINATTCALHGMDFDMETVRWWASKSEDTKACLLSETPLGIVEALSSFHAYLESLKEEYQGELHIWAQGTDFDIAVLRNAYRNIMPGTPTPWHYKNVRDSRTFITMILECAFGCEEHPYDRIPPMPDGEVWVQHSALSDARKVAWNVSYCYGLCRSGIGRTSSGAIRE